MGNACNNPELVEIAGAENAAGTIVTTEVLPKDIESPEAQAFVAAYEAEYGEPLESIWWLMAAEAYNVIAHAIEETGSTDTDVLATYLHEDFKDFPGVTGTIIGFDEKGDRLGTVHQAYVFTEDGELVLSDVQP
jgi:branched-chain amino acid transport system substrate-binding protein